MEHFGKLRVILSKVGGVYFYFFMIIYVSLHSHGTEPVGWSAREPTTHLSPRLDKALLLE